MQITVADIDRLSAPQDAEDLILFAGRNGHQMWASSGPAGTAFQLRICGPGWDIQANWSRPADILTLRSVLLWQDAAGEWTPLPDLDAARIWIGKDRA